MTGWKIFRHSADMVINNLFMAARVSLAIFFLTTVLPENLLLSDDDYLSLTAPDGPSDPSVVMRFMIVSGLSIFGGLWIAVAWHRFVLLQEEPRSYLPPLNSKRMMSYFSRSIIIGAMVVAAAMVASIPAGLVFGMIGGQLGLMLMVAMIAFAALMVFFRLGVVLPAVALDRDMTLREAWETTKPFNKQLFELGGVGIAAILLAMIPAVLTNDPGGMVDRVYHAVIGWFYIMISASVLTTLYGVAIEKRKIS